jgi:hypothetical protein
MEKFESSDPHESMLSGWSYLSLYNNHQREMPNMRPEATITPCSHSHDN